MVSGPLHSKGEESSGDSNLGPTLGTNMQPLRYDGSPGDLDGARLAVAKGYH
jgi:hypothetical protein